MARVALVDDDRNILTSVGMALEAEGFDVETYADGQTALDEIVTRPVDLILLDIKMPRLDGFDFVRRLRQKQATPVIFLTSKDDAVDEELGFRLGGDDYITKPFRQRVLLERVRAVLRRGQARADAAPETSLLRRDRLALDAERRMCWWGDNAVQLTQTEFLLLWALAERPGTVKTREHLMNAAYGQNVFVDDRTVDSHIKRIRKKFRQVDDSFDKIETMYGVGYRFKES